jgi:hypothetical protein
MDVFEQYHPATSGHRTAHVPADVRARIGPIRNYPLEIYLDVRALSFVDLRLASALKLDPVSELAPEGAM